MHQFIPVLSPSFLYHPYIPSFKSKDFSFTCLLSTVVIGEMTCTPLVLVCVTVLSRRSLKWGPSIK